MDQERLPVLSSLEESYPNIARWVQYCGWIELGLDGHSDSFVMALDEGGLVWEGARDYETVDEALHALDIALAEYME